MRFLARMPFLKIAAGLLILYAMVWISLEGRLGQVLLLAFGVTIVGTAFAWQRYLAWSKNAPWRWLAATALTGLLGGLFMGLLVITLMAIKTGLHGHGPEFIPDQVSWVINQIPLWSAVGLLTGLGTGVLIAGLRKD